MKHGRVLLADSHLSLLEGVHRLLDTLFEKVLMVADERSLMDAVTALEPEVVVVDLSLPGTEEANVARRLQRLHPHLRIIVLSVHDEPTVVEGVMKTAAAFVLKRTAGTDLAAAVDAVYAGRGFVSPSVCPGLAAPATRPPRAEGTPP